MIEYNKAKRELQAKKPKRVINFYGEERIDIILFLSSILSVTYHKKVLVIDNTGNGIFRMTFGVGESLSMIKRDSIDFALEYMNYDKSILDNYDIVLNFVGYCMNPDMDFENEEFSNTLVVSNMEKRNTFLCNKIIRRFSIPYDLAIMDFADESIVVNTVEVDLGCPFTHPRKEFVLPFDKSTYKEYIKIEFNKSFKYQNLSEDMQKLLGYLVSILIPDSKRVVLK